MNTSYTQENYPNRKTYVQDEGDMEHYMECRLGDTCTRCNEFIGEFKK